MSADRSRRAVVGWSDGGRLPLSVWSVGVSQCELQLAARLALAERLTMEAFPPPEASQGQKPGFQRRRSTTAPDKGVGQAMTGTTCQLVAELVEGPI